MDDLADPAPPPPRVPFAPSTGASRPQSADPCSTAPAHPNGAAPSLRHAHQRPCQIRARPARATAPRPDLRSSPAPRRSSAGRSRSTSGRFSAPALAPAPHGHASSIPLLADPGQTSAHTDSTPLQTAHLRQIEMDRARSRPAGRINLPAAADAARALPGGGEGSSCGGGGGARRAAALGFSLPSRPRERRERES